MTDEKLDVMINGLTEDLKPVKPLPHPLKRLLPFAAIAIIYVVLVVAFMDLRMDISKKLGDIAFMTEIGLMGFIAISAAITSAYLSIPDMRGRKEMIAVPLTGLAIFTGWILARATHPDAYMPKLGLDHCMGEGMFMTLMPVTALLFLIRKGATTHPKLSALMNILFAGGLGYIGLRFTCMMDAIGHLTISHMLPYILIGAILGIASKKLYKC